MSNDVFYETNGFTLPASADFATDFPSLLPSVGG